MIFITVSPVGRKESFILNPKCILGMEIITHFDESPTTQIRVSGDDQLQRFGLEVKESPEEILDLINKAEFREMSKYKLWTYEASRKARIEMQKYGHERQGSGGKE